MPIVGTPSAKEKCKGPVSPQIKILHEEIKVFSLLRSSNLRELYSSLFID